MMIPIVLAFLPMLWGCVNFLQASRKKDDAEKNSYKIYGKIKVVIGLITGAFLAYLYCSFDFFTGHMGTTVALIICWLIVTLCNLVAHVKIGLDEYDMKQNEKVEESDDE